MRGEPDLIFTAAISPSQIFVIAIGGRELTDSAENVLDLLLHYLLEPIPWWW